MKERRGEVPLAPHPVQMAVEKCGGRQLKCFPFGQDDRPPELGDEIKSISGEETFLQDTEDRKVLRSCVRTQAADIAAWRNTVGSASALSR